MNTNISTSNFPPPKTKMNDLAVWYHHHGNKLNVSDISTSARTLKIFSKAVELTITPTGTLTWKVKYIILQAGGSFEGSVNMNDHELKAAFGLPNEGLSGQSDWLLEKYGGDVAMQGKFIRYRRCLNIPGPGTGHDGDPNVSIYLHNEIKEAVLMIMEQ